MKIVTENYLSSIPALPSQGQHIVAHHTIDEIVVYQAYKESIAKFAVNNQQLGGSEYSYNRMSWIKPNFLWMMFRCGWAEKENQERVLALWIEKKEFDKLLQNAVLSSFDSRYYIDHHTWRKELDMKEVRLQWDPDHDPYGNKLTRRAVQLGLKGGILEDLGKRNIRLVEDVTDFVLEQRHFVKAKQLDRLLIPAERVYTPADINLREKIGID